MEALADKGHKHPYISSSDTLGGTISISTKVIVKVIEKMTIS